MSTSEEAVRHEIVSTIAGYFARIYWQAHGPHHASTTLRTMAVVQYNLVETILADILDQEFGLLHEVTERVRLQDPNASAEIYHQSLIDRIGGLA